MKIDAPERIIVVQIGKIGDMILTTPLFRELKNLFPASKLTVLSAKINKDIPENTDAVDETVVYKKNLLSGFLLVNSSLKNADLWIDTKDSYSKTSELLVKFFKPKFSMGFNFDKKIFDIDLSNFKSGDHAADINLSPVNYFTSERSLNTPTITIPESIRNNPYFNINASGNVLINISAGDKSRYITSDIYLDIIKKINLYELTSFTLIGLRKDLQLINSIMAELKEVNVKFIKTKNILEAAEVVRKSKIVISPDTSIIHLCSAFNIPVIGLYPDVEWNSRKFAPLSEHRKIIISKSKKSLEGIGADEIVNAYIDLKKEISGNAESRTRVRKEDH